MTSAPRLVVVAPDSFKGSLSAVEAAAAEERKKPEPWTDLLALFDKIIKKQE